MLEKRVRPVSVTFEPNTRARHFKPFSQGTVVSDLSLAATSRQFNCMSFFLHLRAKPMGAKGQKFFADLLLGGMKHAFEAQAIPILAADAHAYDGGADIEIKLPLSRAGLRADPAKHMGAIMNQHVLNIGLAQAAKFEKIGQP